MKWLSDNWLTVFSVWMVANVILSPISSKVDPSTWYGKALHVFVAISPMDVLKAFKTLGGALVPPTLPPVAALLLVFGLGGVAVGTSGCSLFSAPAASSTASQPGARALARASVSVLVDAWNVAANTCTDVAQAQHDDTLRQKCDAALTPARNAIVTAASAVDVWDAAAEKNFPCLIDSVVNGLTAAAKLLPALPPAVSDAISVASHYAGVCPSFAAGPLS